MDGHDSLQAELVGESAKSLGIAGARLEAALAALAEGAGDRAMLVDEAAVRAWEYVVLRGALGWHDDAAALDAFRVPREVRLRMGATVGRP